LGSGPKLAAMTSLSPESSLSRIRIGSAPDSWGVWFPDDPQQVPWQRFLDEVAAAGYEWIELGPYGYLPKDPAVLAEETAKRGLKVSAGTVFTGLHHGPDVWEKTWAHVADNAVLAQAMGARHLVVIPSFWRPFWKTPTTRCSLRSGTPFSSVQAPICSGIVAPGPRSGSGWIPRPYGAASSGRSA
jgi:inosose dehydratase